MRSSIKYASSELAEFTRFFRRSLFKQLEYSASDIHGKLGIMVGGEGEAFVSSVYKFSNILPYAKEWQEAARCVNELVKPTRYLFRVDCIGESVKALSLYCRLPDKDIRTTKQAFAAIRPFCWDGPSLTQLSNTVDKNSPEGIGFRISAKGEIGSAIYFRLNVPLAQFRLRMLPNLTRNCGFPDSVAEQIALDMHFLYSNMVGVIGIDSGKEGCAKNLKLDPTQVSIEMANSFLKRKEVNASRIDSLASITRALRLRRYSYVGIKYGRKGFSGWKLYWSISPLQRTHVSSPELHTCLPVILLPTIRTATFTSDMVATNSRQKEEHHASRFY